MFYSIRHITKFQYDNPVSETVMEVRKHPRTEGNQRCLNHALRVSPRSRVFSYRDYLGNMVHHFDVPGRYTRIMLAAVSLVEVQPYEESPAPGSWEQLDAEVAQGDFWEMLKPSQFARPSQELHELKEQLGVERGADPFPTVLRIKHAIYEYFRYVPQSTQVDSPIEDAIRSGQGVCQDFAHIMIAMLRELHIPARYVSGYLFRNREDNSTEGATHAWLEAFLPPAGWVGIDPTNKLLVGEHHVRTAIGRDYADVPPTRGVFKGQAKGQLAVNVRVTLSEAPIEDMAESGAPEKWVGAAEPDAAASDSQQQQQQQQ